MDRVAVFVDAGYFFASGSQLLTGTRTSRGRLNLSVSGVVAALKGLAERVSGLPLLRIYWYDGTDSGPSAQHNELAFHDDVKVRLGRVNRFGEQKGVDSLLVTDVLTLTRARGMATAVLVTGDEDVQIAVQQAQEHGVRVHLLGLWPARSNQSDRLLQEADATHEWGREELGRFLTVLSDERLEVEVPETATDDEVIGAVVDRVVGALEPDERRQLRAMFGGGEWRVPREHDRQLVLTLAEYLDPVEEEHKHRLRDLFKQRV